MPRKRALDDKSAIGASKSKRRNTSQLNDVGKEDKSGLISQNISQNSTQQNVTKSLSQSQSTLNISTQDSSIRSGKLIRMRLINFMCHDNLVINFNDRANLLIGSNGSGKSAILTALVIGLGSSARTTNRSRNVKDLIKNGQTSATIEIEIANSSWDSYNQELFGNKIIVVRTINSSGSSNYKIKNEYGQVIYKNNEQLQKILLYLNIQVDNPVFVLNQDNARSFLRDLDPAKNYQLFLKATQIETVCDKLNQCVHMFRDFQNRLKIFKKKIEISKSEVLELQKKYDRLRSADEFKASLKNYKIEKLWSIVLNQENKVKEIENKLSKLIKQQRKYEHLINNKSAVENEYKEKIRQLEKQIKDLTEEFRRSEQKLNQLKSELDTENEKLQIEERHIRKLRDKISHYEQQINLLKESIDERSLSSNTRLQKLREENEKKIADCQKQIKDLQAMIATARRDIDMITNTKNQYEEKFEEIKHHRQQTIIAYENLQRELKAINASRKDTLHMYGEYTNKLLLSIEREYRKGCFSEMPRGPIGRYIEVADQKWRGVIEYLLLGCINLYLVNTSNDRRVLDEILKNEFPGVKLRIITNQFHHEVYNVQKGMVQPPRGSRLLMNEIKCSDPIVMNCLIDRVHIETILLVENQDLAVQLTSDSENIPQNLQKVILLNPLMEYYPLPLFRAYSLESRQPRFLQVNVDQISGQIESEINRNQQQKELFEKELKELKDQLAEIYRREKQMKTKLDQHERTKNNVNSNLEELQSVEYINEDEVTVLKNELNELEGKLETSKRCFNEKRDLSERYIQEKQNKERLCNEEKMKLNSLENEIKILKKKYDALKLEFNSKLCDVEQWKNENQKILTELENEKGTYQNELQNLETIRTEAEASGERVETTKSEEELTDLIKSLEKKIKQICSTQENVDDIKALLDDKSERLKKNKRLFKLFAETLDLLLESRNLRFSFIKNLKEFMALRVKYYFDSLLKVRRFVGEIRIQHDNRLLTVNIIPRDGDKENAVSSTKSLSGGERSFSTVAFLISLWSCVDHPFYFLDEYDVFTDQVNRQIMTQLLLHEAEKRPKCQYTFLTPQDMSFVKASDIIEIHRLPDPRR